MKVKLLDVHGFVPTRGSEQAAGLDIYSSINITIPAGERRTVKTNISVEIPPKYYGRIAPRSGLANKNGIDVLAGVVDSDYRGELLVILYNTGKEDFVVNRGDRIAQLIIEPYIAPVIEVVEELDETARGASGFGSTGV
jgi:dUTP pyrophosphatase